MGELNRLEFIISYHEHKFSSLNSLVFEIQSTLE